MIINREPEPAHWREVGGGGRPPPGPGLRLAAPLTIAGLAWIVAYFAFDWWIAKRIALGPAGPMLGDYVHADTAGALAGWTAGAVAVLGVMSDRRCLAWTRSFAWPVLTLARRRGLVAAARDVAAITLVCLLLFGLEVVWLKRLLAAEAEAILAFVPCEEGYRCAQAYRGYFDRLGGPVGLFLAVHVALFALLGLVIGWRARRSEALAGLFFSTPHGIFLFHRLDAFALAALAQVSLLIALDANMERAVMLHAERLLATADSATPTLAAMFAGLGDNPLFAGVFLSGLICALGAYAGAFVRLASPFHSLLEAQRALDRLER